MMKRKMMMKMMAMKKTTRMKMMRKTMIQRQVLLLESFSPRSGWEQRQVQDPLLRQIPIRLEVSEVGQILDRTSQEKCLKNSQKE